MARTESGTNDALVTIIVIVYNIEKYILDCLESIASQTYADFECIIVDDGSTDSSGEICDLFCDKDNRFRVIHQDNAGVGPARNTGYVNSSGDYIMFVDGDDTLDPDALRVAYELITSGPYDASIIGYVRTDVSGIVLDPLNEGPEIKVLTGIEAINKLYFGSSYERICFAHAWGKLFSKSSLDGLLSKAFYSGQDLNFIFRYFKQS